MIRLLCLLALFVSAPAFAEDPPTADMARAKELFDNGQILYDEGNYSDAIVAWEESYRLSKYPDLLYNISNAWERLGDYKSAIDVLNRYRAFATADERVTLDRRIAALQERKAKKDEEDRLRAEELARNTPPTNPIGPKEPEPEEPKKKVPVLPVVLIGTGAVGIGLGTVFGLQAGSALSDIKESCAERDGGYLCRDDMAPTVDRHGTMSVASAASLIAGGALAAGGVVLFAVGGSSSDLAISPRIGSDNGISVTGRF